MISKSKINATATSPYDYTDYSYIHKVPKSWVIYHKTYWTDQAFWI